jgi:hypothetical protein
MKLYFKLTFFSGAIAKKPWGTVTPIGEGWQLETSRALLPKNCNDKRQAHPEVLCTLHSPEKVKVNYEPVMGRTIINCKKWDTRLQKAHTRFHLL